MYKEVIRCFELIPYVSCIRPRKLYYLSTFKTLERLCETLNTYLYGTHYISIYVPWYSIFSSLLADGYSEWNIWIVYARNCKYIIIAKNDGVWVKKFSENLLIKIWRKIDIESLSLLNEIFISLKSRNSVHAAKPGREFSKWGRF